MSDEPSNQQNESEPAPLYPRGRFVALLAILFALVAMVGLVQRDARPTAEGPAFTRDVLEGDIAMRLSYAYERWTPLLVGQGQQARIETFRRTQRQIAIAQYQEAVRRNPAPSNVRRLIIAQPPNERSIAIGMLADLAQRRRGLAPEVAMWQRIYLPDGPLTPGEVNTYRAKIRGLELQWFEHLALADMYDRAQMVEEAEGSRSEARESASRTVMLLAGLMFVMFAVGLVGLALLVWYLSARRSGRLPSGGIESGVSESARSFLSGYLLEAFVVYLAVTIGVQVAVAVMLSVYGIDGMSRSAVYLTFGVYAISGAIALLYLWQRIRRSEWSWRTIGVASGNPVADIVWGIGGYAAALPLIVVGGLLSSQLGRYIETPSNPIVPLFVEATTAVERMLLFVLAVGMAPFFEELFFRGALFHSFRARYGIRAGIILSAVVFALVHPFPFDFLPILALGTVLAVLVHQRGSLLSPMVAHAVNNTVSFAMLSILLVS